MKTGIHPEYHFDCKVTCSCGAEFVIGSTLPEIKVEICSKCHPFYTGKQKLVDTEGRVDKFRKRMEQAAAKAAATEPKEEQKEEESKEAPKAEEVKAEETKEKENTEEPKKEEEKAAE